MINVGIKTTTNYSDSIEEKNISKTRYEYFWDTDYPYNINPGKRWVARYREICYGENRKVIVTSEGIEKLRAMSVLQVGEWLDSKKMSMYKEKFEEASIDGPALLNITPEKLRFFGVTKLGHVMTIRRVTGNSSLQIIEA